ncbi:hypothetical protein E3U43_002080 [Larimichthys crocea]|uniref:Uncharacterized protein n=1 Tax=Larimichthys crocea TaxID=215358 RepID=A0ACD3QRT6_LARCR|nr:hypothetical protein E3U43_002080 [Larimichthys crocea]
MQSATSKVNEMSHKNSSNNTEVYFSKRLCVQHITESPWTLTLGIFYSLLKQPRRVSYFTSASPFTAILYWSTRTTHIVSAPRFAVKVIGFIGKWINSSGWLWRASCRV